ncbi:MAG: NAD-dependent epimerase/dehydratase family protein [Motilibacteraceae bacterium]
MRIVVTGGAGFIGANLCRELLSRPGVSEVVALDDLSTGRVQNLEGTGATLLEGSILDDSALDQAIAGAHSVVHLAALPSVPRSIENPLLSHTVNATGTLKVLEAARRHGNVHVALASSSSVYGKNPELPKHEGLLTQPMSPYAVSKLATETYAVTYAQCFGLPTLPFRFFNVYGPLQPADHDYAAVMPIFIDAALDGRPLPINGDGTQSRDFTFVGSVVRVLADAAVNRVTSDTPVNLAFGTRTTLLEAITVLQKVLGHPVEREHRAPRVGDVPHSQASDDRLRALFPDAQPVPFEEGVAATVAWFQEQRAALVHE